MVQKGLNEHETLLKLPNKYHKAQSLLNVVPVLAASYCSDALTHQELEFSSIGNFPCIRADSPSWHQQESWWRVLRECERLLKSRSLGELSLRANSFQRSVGRVKMEPAPGVFRQTYDTKNVASRRLRPQTLECESAVGEGAFAALQRNMPCSRNVSLR